MSYLERLIERALYPLHMHTNTIGNYRIAPSKDKKYNQFDCTGFFKFDVYKWVRDGMRQEILLFTITIEGLDEPTIIAYNNTYAKSKEIADVHHVMDDPMNRTTKIEILD